MGMQSYPAWPPPFETNGNEGIDARFFRFHGRFHVGSQRPVYHLYPLILQSFRVFFRAAAGQNHNGNLLLHNYLEAFLTEGPAVVGVIGKGCHEIHTKGFISEGFCFPDLTAQPFARLHDITRFDSLPCVGP